MALLRFRHAYIIVAVLRSTALRRVVDGLSDRHLRHHRESSSSLHPDVHTVRPHPSGSGRCVLTPGPLRLLSNNQAPHLWCVAPIETVKESPRGGLTGRSTSYLSFSTKIAPGKYNQVGLAMYELPNMIFALILWLVRPQRRGIGVLTRKSSIDEAGQAPRWAEVRT